MNVQQLLKELGLHFLNLTKCGFNYGPQGKMLLKNLEEHWFLHCVTMPPYNIFLSDEIANTLNLVTKNAMSNIPFGFALIENSKNSWNENILPATYKVSYHRTAKVVTISDISGTKDLFLKIQKERKVWWRKLAQYPSRFKLTEAKRSKNFNIVEVEAQFPFGNIIVETVSYHSDIRKLISQADNKKDLETAQIVQHITSLDWGCLALLCDAQNMNKLNNEIHIHTKLAPYKVAFCVTKSENETNTDRDKLNRFVLYLNNILRTKGLNTILTTSEQVINMCLVPFVIVVYRTSLENGIVHVKNQSTTVNEAVHITDLVKYITMHCQ